MPRTRPDRTGKPITAREVSTMSSGVGRALRAVLTTFHASHSAAFVRHAGGDFPLELATLHAQYAGLVSSHVERECNVL